MTKQIIWLASYPKSGNTWMRFLAGNLLYGRIESAAILGEKIPDLHEPSSDSAQFSGARMLKTHFPFSVKLPHADRTQAAVYVVRHPADVIASNFFYARRSEQTVDQSPAAFNAYVDQFLENRGDSRWLEAGMGSWETNVRSWRSASLPFPVLQVRYEDMLADPAAVARQVAGLLGLESSVSDIDAALANSTFQRMREIERADIRGKRVGIFYKPYLEQAIASGRRFMRRGLAGDGTARLSLEQRGALTALFAPLLAELGY